MNMNESWIESPEIQGLADVICGARDTATVSGLTHNFYRYPARFSPAFVRAAIKAFSEPGDWVLDPFAGGGTTLVEAIAHGRHAIGVDVSSLATFISEAKTLILDEQGAETIRRWIGRLPEVVNIHRPACRFDDFADAGYYRNLEGAPYWRLRKAIEQVLASIVRLKHERAQILARCILLKTAQWALDARKSLPTVAQFRAELQQQGETMLFASEDLRARVRANNAVRAICLNRSASGLEQEEIFRSIPAPRLILTSPPYPGIHVLYHRWQVDGRKEAPAPFWIANRLDGAGSSYYTMGDRKYPNLKTYFDNLRTAFSSITQVCGPDTIIAQMVAFSEPDWQLPGYLEVMTDCGLSEIVPWNDCDLIEGRLWREVPNRKWHARQKRHSPGAREVVLLHRKR
ncbi:MAG: DNA methyltransferase [Pseudomonadota bacterium]